ncbi:MULTISPECIES: sensor domain-containing diguanylate cyclase [Rhizobium]|uniref:diguanylate cyclase n=1 Tax=Rhizobium rhododendri TaxID=2506430 RepID=A0ABY8IP22_9HYPH|nr:MULTISPECIES: sensor domain-containing diguanylate cyclase [Rhizobium]MBO9099567.1 sensor domain-containing diguanylate cyclase [Rhizobium sp. L58/93]MBO9135076.1 sensor domain-containing diguanylate cyclase [Rhizobium sp. B209b/85]QXZ81010.1 sensor domain-containing diguanylate cyclase [Rhizobium sp. L51/94]QXZ86958.1 sensor domain-containing diguanylate cyclase [Rhizobium sp. K1/93]QXZ93008.1 sensor domain-containing diguanylate cyclase [Rhizobium sp. K15/93]
MEQSQEIEYEKLLQFVYACPVGLVDMARDGAINLMNPLAMKLVIPLATDGIMTNLLTVFENTAPELRSLIQDFAGRRGTICDNHRIYAGPIAADKPDEQRILNCTIVKLKDERYVVTLTDVSLQVRQERRLREAETWFGSLLEGVKDFGVASLGTDGVIDAVNSTLLEQTGFDAFELEGMPIGDLVEPQPGGQGAYMDRRLEHARRDGWHIDEGWGLRRDGERYWCQSLIAVCADKTAGSDTSIQGYTVIMRKVERRDTDMLELKRLLRTDHLTGAYNRGAFFEAAEKEYVLSRGSGRSFAILMFDIDHFKLINDSYGHSVGDDVLRSVANACQTMMRPGDTFARIGGEEFTILLPDTSLEESVEIAERVRIAIASVPVSVGDSLLKVTASFGCAAGPLSVGSAAALLAAADGALYRAKRAGRNRTESAPMKTVLA